MNIPFTIAGLQAAYREESTGPVAIAHETLRRVATCEDPAIWITLVPDDIVIAQAEALQRDPAAKALPLYGVPFAVKDNIDCEGMPTTAACPAFAYTPEKDATVVARLRKAGAILIGKTNMDQFATGLVGMRSPYGVPRCVFNNDYISGGSSSGSAVAMARGLVPFTLGTDTAGSGRVPAAYNNIVGLKPTRGLISTTGVVPACRTLDCVSIFAGTVGDAVKVLRVARGFDEADAFSRAAPARGLPQHNFRFGVLKLEDREFFGESENAALYDKAIARLESLGGTAVAINFAPFRDAGTRLYGGAWAAERLSVLRDFMAEHENDMEPTVRQIVSAARRFSAADAFADYYYRAEMQRAAETEWARMDVLMLPTAPTQYTVFATAADPIARNAQLGIYTTFANLLDCSAIAIPSGFRSDGLAFGITLIAPAFCDDALAHFGDRLHRADNSGIGIARETMLPDNMLKCAVPTEIPLLVLGAHLSGMPLNPELRALGAYMISEVRTAPLYRLYALSGTAPPKPGMVRAGPHAGDTIQGELWMLSPAAFGHFTAAIPAPLGIGKVQLEDGREVSGFLCEPYATTDAVDITDFGGWRAWIERR